LKLLVGAKLLLNDFPKEFEEYIIDLSTAENPAYRYYQQRKKSNPWIKDIPPEKYIFYAYKGKHSLVAPRGLLETILQEFPNVEVESILAAPKADFTFNGRSYPDQDEAVEALVQHNFASLQAPTGSGKTICALLTAAELNLRTLFLVHKLLLLRQTAERVEQFLNITPSILHGKKFEIGDFNIATVQTMIRRDLGKVANEFGLICLDEAHHSTGPTFQEVLQSFNAKHVYGFTATPGPNRQHMYLAIGPIVHKVDRSMLIEKGRVLAPLIKIINTGIRFKNILDGTHTVNQLVKHTERNNLLFQKIEDNLEGRKTLLLSGRTDHAEYFYNRLKGYNPTLLHGKLPKDAQRQAIKDIKVSSLTSATYDIIGEGFDEPEWDVLFLLTPVGGDIRSEQSVGRICRAFHSKNQPIVYDFSDNGNDLLDMWLKNRLKIYKRIQAEVMYE